MRVTRSRELVAEGYRPAAVARVAQISRQAIYRVPKPRQVARKREPGPLDALSDPEREVLALVAEGHSNGAIAEKLFFSRKTVEAHASQILLKLDLGASPDRNRRVLAVLAFSRAPSPNPTPARSSFRVPGSWGAFEGAIRGAA